MEKKRLEVQVDVLNLEKIKQIYAMWEERIHERSPEKFIRAVDRIFHEIKSSGSAGNIVAGDDLEIDVNDSIDTKEQIGG